MKLLEERIRKDGMIKMSDGTLVKAEIRLAEGATDTDPAEN